jgi:hypothetical protein
MRVIISAVIDTITEMYNKEKAGPKVCDRVSYAVKDIFYYLALPIRFLSLFSSKIHPKGRIIVTSLLMGIGMERVVSILLVNHVTLLGISRVVIGSYFMTTIL